MLDQLNVLDLSNEQGLFCGYLLSHLGAEVISIEPPGGSSARRVPPFHDGKSLWWEAYGRGRQSLGLDLSSRSEMGQLEKLIQNADILIESFTSAEIESFGLQYNRLAEINPALIVVSITPFGRTGPRANWPATDLTVWAASGAHSLAGDADRAPVRTSVPQSFLHAGGDAAGAALIALQARHKTGLGQHVDVSAQQSCAQACLGANLSAPNHSDMLIQREAGGLSGAFPVKLTWRCANGYVAITLLFGPAFSAPNKRLLQWVHDEGFCSKEDADLDWGIAIAGMLINGEPPQAYFELCRKIETFTLTKTKEYLFEEGLSRSVFIAPTLTTEGLLQEKHFHSRDYWQQITISGQSVAAPGPIAKFSATPSKRQEAAPPLNSHSLKDFSSANEVTTIPVSTSSAELPLAGLKVLDFMWVIAGPLFTRSLRDYGATIIRVESSSRVDPVRASPPFHSDEQSLNHGALFNSFNAGKRSVTIDPSNPVGKEVILDLVRWADVVTESFSPKAMKAWGLDYESLRAVNPDIIMLSSCLMGQTGDRALIPGYGNMAAAITSFYELTGWPDRSPAGPYLAYTDGVAPRFMLASLMAALEHKRNGGSGQHIDLSQAEAAIHMLSPAILDFELNEHVWPRRGNRDLQFCPHGVFETKADNRWVALACQTDADWHALCELGDLKKTLDLSKLKTVDQRAEREDEIENVITAWTTTLHEADLVEKLIDAGIAAYLVQNSADAVADPQMQFRDHFTKVQHSLIGDYVIEGGRFKLSGTPAQLTTAGPELGESNVDVLTETLGYDMDKVADIFASLAME
jgi:crotonobetainyl-CoA:carnitine CoA-transferase CaiB-like acyl-CoA transferase